MAKKKYQIGIIAQVAILFVIGSLVTGVITYFTQRFYAEGNVQKQTKTLGADIAANVVNSVREYPAYEWLLRYWHAHSAELDIEYDVEFTTESTATERKYRTLQARHPELLADYAAADAIDALPPEDQKLYAEIVYSWLITRINDIARSYKTDYLFCLLTDEPYDRQFFLFSAAASGAERGSKYEQAYTLGTTVTVTPAQQAAMRQACQMTSQLADAGDYVDYYSYFEALDGHDILIGMTFNLKAIWGDVSEQTVIGTMLALSIQTWLSLICLALIYIFVLRPLKSVQRDIQLSVGHGGHHLELGGVGVFVILHGGVPAQVQVAVKPDLALRGVFADGLREAFAQLAVQRLADGNVRAAHVQQRLLAGEPVIQDAAQGDRGDEGQHQRELVILKDVVKPLRQGHAGQGLPVFRPLPVGQLHGSAPSSVASSGASSAFGALGS